MTVSHATATRNALADRIDELINTGSTDAQGDLVLIDSTGPTDLVEWNLQDPAFGTASSGQISLNGTTLSTTAGATGTVDSFELRDKDNNVVLSGSVTSTGGGGDIEIDNTDINSGQTVEVSNFSYTAPS